MRFQWIDLEVTLFAGLTVLTLVALLVVIVLRNGRRATHLIRRRLQCPVEGRPATVDFVIRANDGAASLEVVRCSLLPPGMPVKCGMVCRSAAGAR